ncbi:60S acidic ribosomal protein family [Arabidopsis thaliana]|uniref:60S acidic ribosomal protein family n=1 Tax=Arabidopsis thaliana TaxID=3702 RepID=F4IGR3_ARATH|nr:60S acidic ribosomal protein family [Arabidopsis thaliana]AEC08032.1 60S acidic ribosomal protein family [Arabidopsis thaliana]|eukprot:NP_001189621.1 60S acidic ribosomal protein family [Arabidopsis thaliana]
MKVVAAYLLAVLSGKASPTSADIKTILGSVGAETEDSQIELLLKEVKGKDLAELIAAGREKLASVPSGGGASAAESKKEEKKEEKEESDDDMGFSLFE